jgi:hypothetical protein
MGPPLNWGMPVAECGLKKKTKKIRNPQSEITGPMLSADHALDPGLGQRQRIAPKRAICSLPFEKTILFMLWSESFESVSIQILGFVRKQSDGSPNRSK